MNVEARVTLKACLWVGALAGSAVFVGCGGDSPPAKIPDQRPPPVISIPQVVDAGATADVVDAGPPAPTLAPPSFVAHRQGTVKAIAVDGHWVYWLTSDGDVKRAQVDGGAAMKVGSFGANVDAFDVENAHVFVASFDPKASTTSIDKISADTITKPIHISTSAGIVVALAVDGERVAWIVSGKVKPAVFVQDHEGGTAKRFPITSALTATTMALGKSDVYFADGLAITRVALPKGDLSKVLDVGGNHPIRSFAVTPSAIFAGVEGDIDAKNGSIFSLANGAAAPTVAAGNQGMPVAMVADETNLYWVDRGTMKASWADGRVMKMPLAGGAPTVLADHQTAPSQIALDDENVYWTNDNTDASSTDSDVLKIAK